MDEICVTGIQYIKSRVASPSSPEKVLKPTFKVDFLQNPFFGGRDGELEKIHSLLADAKRRKFPGLCTIHGMGGLGKTQVALEYAYRYRHDYKHILWLPAEHGPSLAQRFGTIAKMLDESSVALNGYEDLNASVQASKQYIEQLGKTVKTSNKPSLTICRR